MAYVAVKGGREAIDNSLSFFDIQRGILQEDTPSLQAVMNSVPLLVDRIMGEGSLYAPTIAASAILQTAGDTLEAAFMVRAYRTTLPRLAYSEPISTSTMRVQRRISSAFKEIPGGQILGPTPDYSLRLIDLADSSEEKQALLKSFLTTAIDKEDIPESFPKMIEMLRKEGLVADRSCLGETEKSPFDVTRHSMEFPPQRSAALQTMARGETGGMLALAYSNVRGYGTAHPTIGELRVGTIVVQVRNPLDGTLVPAAEIVVTESETITHVKSVNGKPLFQVGYGICFGQNETKAISMAILDSAMRTDFPEYPSEDSEFVLSHIDGIESMGFTNHFKLPHYVTFQSDLDRLRKSQSLFEEVEME